MPIPSYDYYSSIKRLLGVDDQEPEQGQDSAPSPVPTPSTPQTGIASYVSSDDRLPARGSEEESRMKDNLWAHHDVNMMSQDQADLNPPKPPMVDDTYANRLGYGYDTGHALPAGGSLAGLAAHAYNMPNDLAGFDPNAVPNYEWKDTPSMGHSFRTLVNTGNTIDGRPTSARTADDVVSGIENKREAGDIATQHYINELGQIGRSRMAEIQSQDPYADLRMKAEAQAYPERIKAMTELEKTNRELQSKEAVAQLENAVKARIAQTDAQARRDAAQMMGPGRELVKSRLERQNQNDYYQARQQEDAKLMTKQTMLANEPDPVKKAAGLKDALAQHSQALDNLDHAYGRTNYRETQSEEIISTNPAEK